MKTHKFYHEAMATSFSMQLVHEDGDLASYVAELCIRRINELELKLSRFVADSDISRINKMKKGESLMIDFETHVCLKKAIAVSSVTEGRFDVGVAELSNIYRGYQQGILDDFEYNKAIEAALEEKAKGSLYVVPDQPMISCIEPGIQIDLGGIGKGYALDELGKICVENEVVHYQLDAGGSTVLVGDGGSWTHWLVASTEKVERSLEGGSISASGSSQQGDHIFNPITGKNDWRIYDRLWVNANEAALSDAYTTAFFSMSADEIQRILDNIEEISWVAYAQEGKIKYLYKTEKQLI